MTSGCLSFLSASHLGITSTPAAFSTRAFSFRSNKLNHESSSYQHQILGLGHSPHPPSFVQGSKVPVSRTCAAAINIKPIRGDQMLVYVPQHPLISHWVSVLRNKLTPPPLFRIQSVGSQNVRGNVSQHCLKTATFSFLDCLARFIPESRFGSAMAELGRILICEASRDWLVTVSGKIQTPCAIAEGEFIDPREPVKTIPVLRAGSVLVEQVGSVLPAKQTYHLASVHRIPVTCSASKEDGAPSKGSVHFWSAGDCPSPPTVGAEAEKVGVQSRRSFCGACLFGLAALPVSCHGDEAIAVAATTRKEVMKEAPSPFDEGRLLQQNRRMHKLNGAPDGFPGFIREGFNVKVITDDKYVTTKTGLIYYDLVEGQGEPPQDGQQVIFHYTGYNESGRRVDSSYQQGQPARTRVGINGMIPGFEEGIKSMRVGGKRRIIIPPDLGPPVGPSTFFSAKQFEVFDVELLDVKSCTRRTVFLYSDVVCE